MPTPTHYSRRSFLATCAAAGCIVATASGCSDSTTDRKLVFATLADALRQLDLAATATPLNPAATWSWSKTLLHCAQSIEYSMSGYPESRSALFQNTAGSVAFSFFKSRGRMSHNLLEAIPGAASIDANAAAPVAVAALRKAIATFGKHTGPLKPHFAYGALAHAEYEQAHAMHIANHMSGFDLKA
ncbi:MAG: DUF1569 domain-containing protein [Pseudomonadota bacterium]